MTLRDEILQALRDVGQNQAQHGYQASDEADRSSMDGDHHIEIRQRQRASMHHEIAAVLFELADRIEDPLTGEHSGEQSEPKPPETTPP